MSDRECFVYVDLGGKPILAGRLWARLRKGRETATFEYDRSWLTHPERFSLEPALAVGPGLFHTAGDRPLFGAIGDSAPDRWGRVLMRRAERRRAEKAGERPRTLQEIDFLLMVDDEARQGALRFADVAGGSFLACESGAGGSGRIPPLVALPKLLSASDRVLAEEDSDEDLRLLLAPGSSLGGARPKASVRDRGGQLAVAKFPQRNDETDVIGGEAVALALAGRAGIEVPEWRLESVARRRILLLRRFDRDGGVRVPFLSAMSMLGAGDHETRSYLEIADALRLHGAAPRQDLRALWRRMVFNVLVSNTDDHLRNHGFLWSGRGGWRLSPAYDLNPVPADIAPRMLCLAIDVDDRRASLESALRVAEYFELEPHEAGTIAGEVGKVVSGWRRQASRLGLAAAAIERMASAFEHDDLRAAAALGRRRASGER